MTHEAQAIKLRELELQLARVVSDIESEKGTRVRVNSEITRRLESIEQNQRRTERIIYMLSGGLAVLQFFLSR